MAGPRLQRAAARERFRACARAATAIAARSDSAALGAAARVAGRVPAGAGAGLGAGRAACPAVHLKDARRALPLHAARPAPRRPVGELPAAPARPGLVRAVGRGPGRRRARPAAAARGRRGRRRAGARAAHRRDAQAAARPPPRSVGGVHIGAASWPSGHATAALALALVRRAGRAGAAARRSWRRSARLFALAVGVRAADPRLAHAERRARRLPRGARCGRRSRVAALRAAERRWPQPRRARASAASDPRLASAAVRPGVPQRLG